MYTFNAKDVLLSLALNMQFYEKTEQWDKLGNATALYNYVKHNSIGGVIDLTAEQWEVYLTGDLQWASDYCATF